MSKHKEKLAKKLASLPKEKEKLVHLKKDYKDRLCYCYKLGDAQTESFVQSKDRGADAAGCVIYRIYAPGDPLGNNEYRVKWHKWKVEGEFRYSTLMFGYSDKWIAETQDFLAKELEIAKMFGEEPDRAIKDMDYIIHRWKRQRKEIEKHTYNPPMASGTDVKPISDTMLELYSALEKYLKSKVPEAMQEKPAQPARKAGVSAARRRLNERRAARAAEGGAASSSGRKEEIEARMAARRAARAGGSPAMAEKKIMRLEKFPHVRAALLRKLFAASEDNAAKIKKAAGGMLGGDDFDLDGLSLDDKKKEPAAISAKEEKIVDMYVKEPCHGKMIDTLAGMKDMHPVFTELASSNLNDDDFDLDF